jgi:hypothetical protein
MTHIEQCLADIRTELKALRAEFQSEQVLKGLHELLKDSCKHGETDSTEPNQPAAKVGKRIKG